ncbi:MAG: SpoIID/LytB domain-containing protein [[Clostridium] scindens]
MPGRWNFGLRREGVVIINELPVETYLCKVVPSEMPASYELEALKAQAVCARSYAYQQMAEYGYPEYEAHVNDSTDYQVYGNSQAQEASSQAVSETQGQVARFNGQIVTTYYYSTSCGKTTSLEAWGTEANEQNQYLRPS